MASSSKEMELAIKIAGKVEASFTNALGKAGSGVMQLSKTITAATAAAAAAVGAIAVAAVNVGKEFETAMSQVQATMLLDTGTAEGAAAMATLEEAAREGGRTTAFSATEAAEALNYLALAGYNADEAATALPAVLKLAGAGAMDLARASDMVTDSMSALGIEATEANLNTFADQLAQTASKANTSVSQLGEAILTVGGTAKGLAGGTTELNTALGILADNGLKGAEGGTHLRNIILSLQNPTDKAAASLQSLGVDVYDAQGNMRGLNDVFKDLQGAMAGMDNASKDSILSTLFNKTDLTAANAMLSNCTERFDELSAAVENSAGACENMYAIQLDNLNGDIDILKSGLSDLGISIYQDLNGPLREMTQLATSMVGELSEAYKSGGMEGMVGAVGGCMAEVVNTIADYISRVDLIGSFVQGIADNAGPLADAAAQTLTVFIDGLFSLVPQVLLAGIDILTQFVQSMTAQLPKLISTGTQAIVNFVNGIIQRLPEVISTALTLVQTLVNSIGQNAPMLINAAIQLIGNLVLGIVSMLPQLIQMGIQLILSLVQGIISNLPQILQMGVQIIISLVSGITQMLPTIIQGGIQLIISLIQGIIANLGNIVQAAVQIVMALITGLIAAIPQLIAAIPQLVGAIIDAIFSTDWLQVGADIIGGIADGFLDGFFGLVDTVKGLWSSFTGWLFGDDESEAEAEQSGQAAANSYASGISNNGSLQTAMSTIADTFSSMDTSGATAAGTQAGTAFSTGLTDSMASGGLDTAAFSANMTSMGTDGAAALNTSLTAGLATPIDTSGLLDAGAINTSMTAAGTDGAAALTLGLNTGLSGATINTGALAVDTSGLTTTMTAAGTDGAAAIGTGMTGNSQAVTQAATTLGTDINTALDSGWQKANTNAQTAMQRLATTVTDAARSAASAVKAAFENMTITIPKPRIPVISVSTNSVSYGDGGSVSVPQFSVNWNALGGIFGAPTVLNTASNGLQGVGEAGAEAVLPLDTLWSKMKSMLDSAIKESSGGSIIESLLQRLQGIGTGGGGGGTVGPELAGAGGPNISYSPTYNLYGSATKEDAVEAERMSQAEFNQMMKQWQRENDRKKF